MRLPSFGTVLVVGGAAIGALGVLAVGVDLHKAALNASGTDVQRGAVPCGSCETRAGGKTRS